jgi:hypothetical protein
MAAPQSHGRLRHNFTGERMTYKRTTGGKHWWKRLGWSAVIRGVYAHMKSGAVYQIDERGTWHRLHPAE